MDEEQKDLRYILPGLAVATLAVASLALADRRLASWTGGASLVKLFSALLGSGAAGFLLAQAYFALPWARVDYTQWVVENRMRLEPLLGSLERFRCHAQLHRREAWEIVHYMWEARVADPKKALNRSVSRLASRMSAIGTTLFGTVLASAVWLAVAIRALVTGHGSYVRLVMGCALLLAAGYSLWSAYRGVAGSIERIVLQHLSHVLDEHEGAPRPEGPPGGRDSHC